MTLFFMHITKTAGGTIKAMLRDCQVAVRFHYPNENTYTPDFRYSFATNVLYGHYIYGAHAHMGQIPNYACFLRDPINRTISHFHHLHNVEQGRLGALARAHGDIGAFVTKANHWEMDNFQTRVIAGIGNDVKFGQLTPMHLKQAMDNLEAHFRFIGIFEDLQNSLHRLQGLLPEIKGNLPHVNKGAYEKDIPPDQLQLLRRINHFDQVLYDYGKALAPSRTVKAAPTVLKKVS
ncbi:MAG: sulfotransferase family 2 domain-containing protein [Pseudomonadota bacterium]